MMKKYSVLRRLSQVSVVGVGAFLGIQHQVVGGGPKGSAPIDSYCPFGGIETLYSYITAGKFLDKTNVSNFVLLAAIVLMAVLIGSAFCSWLCPFGAVQEWLGSLGQKIFGRNISIPGKIHQKLRNLRYVSLIIILGFTIRESSMIFEAYDPFKILFHFNFETTAAIVIFVVTIAASLLIDRLWCKYLCPLGAVISIFGRFNLINIFRNADECTECGICTKHCKQNIDVDKQTKIPASECTKCMECVGSCPKPGALSLTLGGEGK